MKDSSSDAFASDPTVGPSPSFQLGISTALLPSDSEIAHPISDDSDSDVIVKIRLDPGGCSGVVIGITGVGDDEHGWGVSSRGLRHNAGPSGVTRTVGGQSWNDGDVIGCIAASFDPDSPEGLATTVTISSSWTPSIP